MDRALELAQRGAGAVEPNPMVGCVVAQGAAIVGEGWHGRFGGPHAEVVALHSAGPQAVGATLYVTLEPCCHFGKTPPCSRAVIEAGIQRVVVAQRDPFPAVDGGGVSELERAGLRVDVGLCEDVARRLNAPYLKLLATARPWVIAKWAMTLDGKIATRSGESRWISGERSRRVVHDLRGRVDGILVGRGTAERDDPSLIARPPGLRVATRVVLDRQARLPLDLRLLRTAGETPTMVVTGRDAPVDRLDALRRIGCEVLTLDAVDSAERLAAMLDEFGRRRWTNLLVEGGGAVLGAFFDAQLVDETHVYVAPKVIGGATAPSPVAGLGLDRIGDVRLWSDVQVETLDADVRIVARK